MKTLVFLTSFFISITSIASSASIKYEQLCQSLKTKSQSELDRAYRAAPAGEIPDGPTYGCVLGRPKLPLNPQISQLLNTLWKGKVFDNKSGTTKNKIANSESVEANVYYGMSMLDGKVSVVIDYSHQNYPFNLVRDEIREISPGIYLGRAYLKSNQQQHLIVNFALIK